MKTQSELQADAYRSAFIAMTSLFLIMFSIKQCTVSQMNYQHIQSEKNKYEVIENMKKDHYFIKSHYADSMRAIEWKKNHIKKQGDE